MNTGVPALPQTVDSGTNMTEWLRSIGVLRDDGRASLPVLDRCFDCRSSKGCGQCAGCRSGLVCHQLPPCPRCGVVQLVESERIARHPLHSQLYGQAPEREVFGTANGALFVQSVASLGIIEPVLGLEAEEEDETGLPFGSVLVLSGWRRVLAARACGASQIPVRLVDPSALPRRGDTDLVIVSANFQRQKTIDEIRAEVQTWKRALLQASVRQPKSWELRSAVATIMGVSTRTVRQADAATADNRLLLARKRTEVVEEILVERTGLLHADPSGSTMLQRLRDEQQPGDLRGSDILSALAERNEALLSSNRDDVVFASIGRAEQAAEGRSILDIADVGPMWPQVTDEGEPPTTVAGRQRVTLPSRPGAIGHVGIADIPNESSESIATATRPLVVGNLSVYLRKPDDVPFDCPASVDLIVSAPSWIEPLVRPLLTSGHTRFDQDWRGLLHRCLLSWRRVVRPGGRLLLILPVSTPLYPGMPVLYTAIDELRQTGWAIGGTLVLDDPSLRGPIYAVPDPDRVMTPNGPARLVLTAAPVPEDGVGTDDDRWRAAWDVPLPGQHSRQVASVEEAALSHLWKYSGPGRRSRWLPDFQPGLLYHLVRIFSRPDAIVFLPELGGANFVRGCLRSGRKVVASTDQSDQIAEVVGRIRPEPELASAPRSLDSLESVTGSADREDDDDN